MKPVLDLGVFDLAEIAIYLQNEFTEILGQVLDAQVPVQLGLLDHLPDLGF